MSSPLDKLINSRFVEDLVHCWRGSAQAKDAKTGKYVLSNYHSSSRFGISNPEAVYGYTIQDLDLVMNSKWGNTAKRIEAQDYQICETKQPLVDKNRVFLTAKGRVYLHNVNKYPIMNTKNQVSLILTTNEDITSSILPSELLKLYQDQYGIEHRREFLSIFLEHIGVYDVFDVLPTIAELNVLFGLARYSKLKLVAEKLHLSLKTVDTHMRNLRDKSKISLHDVITIIKY